MVTSLSFNKGDLDLEREGMKEDKMDRVRKRRKERERETDRHRKMGEKSKVRQWEWERKIEWDG